MNSLTDRQLVDPWNHARTPYRARTRYVRPSQVRARVRARHVSAAHPSHTAEWALAAVCLLVWFVATGLVR